MMYLGEVGSRLNRVQVKWGFKYDNRDLTRSITETKINLSRVPSESESLTSQNLFDP